jgi:S-adenosylmethionine-diacylglycerol 3-amino-3-carboxypropyl transferase
MVIRLRDLAFQHAFARMFVYNILWEDAEVDERFLGVDEESNVLSISAAGCGLAGLMSRRPSRVDAVDINRHHLALSALKVTAAQRLRSYGEFYDFFGRGWSPTPEKAVRRLAQYLPPWMQKYWKRQHRLFRRSLYQEGLTAQMLRFFRAQTGIDDQWMRWVITQPVEERIRAVDEWITPVLERPLAKAFLQSPLQLLALGINFEQADKYVAQEAAGGLVGAFRSTITKLAYTNLETNWIAWYVTTGGFDHENPEAVAPYLRRDRHERSFGAPTSVRYHLGNLFDVLAEAGSNTWSHFTFCDAPDWMSPPSQKSLLDEVIRTGKEGAVMLVRSVENQSVVEKCDYQRRFVRMDFESDEATRLDRSRLYQRVDFYRLAS